MPDYLQATLLLVIASGVLVIGVSTAYLVYVKRYETKRSILLYSSNFIKKWSETEFQQITRDISLIVSRGELNFKSLVYGGSDTERDLYVRLAALLNLFEEMAQAIDYKLADEQLLRTYFSDIATDLYYETTDFILALRERTGSPQVYASFERMVARWHRLRELIPESKGV